MAFVYPHRNTWMKRAPHAEEAVKLKASKLTVRMFRRRRRLQGVASNHRLTLATQEKPSKVVDQDWVSELDSHSVESRD
jgi:hypothetical protein